MNMRNIRMLLEYDGTLFSGWQVQPGERTVQAVLESAVSQMLGQSLRLTGASRTDAGVHALGQVANFHTTASYSPEVFQRALNAILPRDVGVKSAEEAEDEFHARYSAKSKMYRYIIYNRKQRPVFDRSYCWHLPLNLDLEAMKKAAQLFIGTHDFSSFRSSSCAAKSPVREIYEINVYLPDESIIHIDMSASGFLKQMARTIAGTLVSIGQGKLTPEQVPEIIEARDRSLAGPTAPAKGLFLVKVEYRK
jgi:tRNA pseudouridine38-40 synthase